MNTRGPRPPGPTAAARVLPRALRDPWLPCPSQDTPEAAGVGRLRHRITEVLGRYNASHLADPVALVASEL